MHICWEEKEEEEEKTERCFENVEHKHGKDILFVWYGSVLLCLFSYLFMFFFMLGTGNLTVIISWARGFGLIEPNVICMLLC